MKPYGYKKLRHPPGDGCFLCVRMKKSTKTAERRKAKLEIKKEMVLSSNE